MKTSTALSQKAPITHVKIASILRARADALAAQRSTVGTTGISSAPIIRQTARVACGAWAWAVRQDCGAHHWVYSGHTHRLGLVPLPSAEYQAARAADHNTTRCRYAPAVVEPWNRLNAFAQWAERLPGVTGLPDMPVDRWAWAMRQLATYIEARRPGKGGEGMTKVRRHFKQELLRLKDEGECVSRWKNTLAEAGVSSEALNKIRLPEAIALFVDLPAEATRVEIDDAVTRYTLKRIDQANTETATSAGGQEKTKQLQVALTGSEQEFLVALYKKKAFDSDSRCKIAVIVSEYKMSEDTCKGASANLGKKKLTLSKGNAGGGVWLTDEGAARAKSIAEMTTVKAPIGHR